MEEAATVREWTDLLRRVRFGANVRVPGVSRGVRGSTVRAVALMLATYADGDGSRVFPGTARLSVACEMDYRTIKRCLSVLRHLGLITPVRQVRRRGHAEEYQLTIPVDLLERLEVLSPRQMEEEVERIREANRRTSTGAARTRTPDPVRVPHAPEHTHERDSVRVPETPVPEGPRDARTGAGSTPSPPGTGAGSTAVRVRPAPPTHHDLVTTTTHQHHVTLTTESANSPRASGRSENPISSEGDTEPGACECGVYFDPDGVCRNRYCARSAVIVPLRRRVA